MTTTSGTFAVCMILALAPVAQAAPDDHGDTPLASTDRAKTVAPADATGDEDFGTATDSVVALTFLDFFFFTGTEVPMDLSTGARGCAAVGPQNVCGWGAGLQLPTGAQIRGMELSACDLDPLAQVRFWIITIPKVPAPVQLLSPLAGTGIPGTPGCATFPVTLPSPVTVMNDAASYGLVVNSTPGINVSWNQFRVRYRLQVSPAPATATFPNDVPTTHPFFRFVEALAAAGISGGCGQGSFCPDSAVTRGQMAVFLATALGLHFPN